MSRTPTPLYREIASTMRAIRSCQEAGNAEWEGKHCESLKTLVDYLPSGSGIDNGVKLDTDRSKVDKLVFTFSYHHMNDGGCYDGWTDHTLTVRPSFDGVDLHISGRDRNQIKEYLYDIFHHALTALVVQNEVGDWNYQPYAPLLFAGTV